MKNVKQYKKQLSYYIKGMRVQIVKVAPIAELKKLKQHLEAGNNFKFGVLKIENKGV